MKAFLMTSLRIMLEQHPRDDFPLPDLEGDPVRLVDPALPLGGCEHHGGRPVGSGHHLRRAAEGDTPCALSPAPFAHDDEEDLLILPGEGRDTVVVDRFAERLLFEGDGADAAGLSPGRGDLIRPGRERKVPLIFCFRFIIRIFPSARLLAKGTLKS